MVRPSRTDATFTEPRSLGWRTDLLFVLGGDGSETLVAECELFRALSACMVSRGSGAQRV